MIELYLLAAAAGLFVAAAILAIRALVWRREALALSADARATYDHAVGLLKEGTQAYREATEAAVAARSANRQAFETMAALAEEGRVYHRGTRH